jgi:serine/threonine protein kinase/tetratricopeptide (TPR) repeat protein
MNADRWHKLRSLVEELMDADAAAQARLLENAGATDAALAAEARSLADRAREGSGPMPAPLADAAETIVSELAAAELLGRRFGPYRAVGLIGEGAMGTVYRAVRADESFEKQVAVKVLRRGVTGEEARRRFDQERRLLARLEHPGICALLDGGTTQDGLAYIVMEHVQGVPLSEWAHSRGDGVPHRRTEGTSWRRERRLRLGLFAEICAAVSYAHSCGVVHRDLKPTNILVAEGQPSSGHGRGAPRIKIIDFGVARVLGGAPQDGLTGSDSGFVGTLPYMAPEQVSAGGGADARTDLYALGVILYELLAGRPPLELRERSVADAARAIAEDEPTRLGLIDRTLRGDLETIVRRAMDKEPARRYPSVSELQADIQRCLRDEPIVARPPSAAYQLSKFVRRHRSLVGATLLAFVALLASTIAAATAWARSERERRRAADVSAFMGDVLASVDPFRPPTGPGAAAIRSDGAGADGVQVTDLLDAAVRRLDAREIADELTEAEVRQRLGAAYSGQGRHDQAIAQLGRARGVEQRLLGPDDPRTIETSIDLATALTRGDRLDQARPLHEASLAAARAVLGPDHPVTLRAMFELSMHDIHALQFQEAATLSSQIMDACERAGHPEAPVAALAAGVRSVAMIFTGDPDAEQAARVALSQIQRTCGGSHYLAGLVQCSLGGSAQSRGDWPEAESRFRAAYTIYHTLLGDRDPRTASRLRSLGVVLNSQGRFVEAEAILRRAAEVGQVGTPLAVEVAGMARRDLAESLRGQGKVSEAAEVEALVPVAPGSASR